MNTVTPISFSGWNMSPMQLFGSGPKMDVKCGNCRGTFSGRIQMVDLPTLKCPYCGSLNEIPVRIELEK